MKNDKEKQKLQKLIESLVHEEVSKLNEGVITDHPFLGGFIQPFTDIFKVAKAELSKVTAKVFLNTKKLAKQTVAFSIPFIGISAISKAEQEANRAIEERIKSVNAEHREVYERIWTTLKNPDVLGFMFLLDPVLPLTNNFALAVKLLKDIPGPLLSVLEILTGGHPGVANLSRRYREATKVPTFGGGGYGSGGGGGASGMGDLGGWGIGGDGDGGGFGEAKHYRNNSNRSTDNKTNLREQTQQPQTKTKTDPTKALAAEIQKLLKDPDIQQRIENNPVVKQFQAAGIDALVNSIKPVVAAKSYEDLKRVVPNFNKIEAEINKAIPDEQATPEQLQQYKEAFVAEFKEVYKQMFAEQIKNMLSSETGAAGQKLLNKVLQQIKSL